MKKFRIAVLNPTCLDVAGHSRFATTPEPDLDLVMPASVRHLEARKLEAFVAEADALVLPAAIRNWPGSREMKSLPCLRLLSVAASGYEWLDVASATAEGIVVANCQIDEAAEIVAELVFALTGCLARGIPHHHHALKGGNAERGMGVRISGKTLGIVGWGKIGQATARLAAGHGLHTLCYSPSLTQTSALPHGVSVAGSLAELLAKSDFVSLHARLTSQSTGLIGAREFAQMKPGAFLINTARPQLVDEAALLAALQNGRLAGAAMDDPPTAHRDALFALPNFIALPHLGNRGLEAAIAVFESAVDNALRFLRGGRPQFLINPDVFERGLRDAKARSFHDPTPSLT